MNLRILSVALLAAAASAFCLTATASATTLLTTESEIYTGAIAAEAEGHVVLDNPIATINCASTVGGEIESHGEGVPAAGKVTTLAFTGCTNSWHVTVVSGGTLSVEHTSGSNGTVVSNGATVEATRFGVTCRYATSNTKIGTLTGGSPATLDIEAAIPFHSGSFLCGSGTTTWTGSYAVTTPAVLNVGKVAAEPVVVLEGPAEGKFPENEARELVIKDGKSEVEYTVEKAIVVEKVGKWKAIEAANCVNKVVPKQEKAGFVICKMKAECAAKGDKADFEIHLAWEGVKAKDVAKFECV